MSVLVVHDNALASYRFARAHPLVPERFTLAIDLARGWGLLGGVDGGGADVIGAPACSAGDLLRIHDKRYVAVVRDETTPEYVDEWFGLGEGDTPRFPGMHEAAALTAGATVQALDAVLGGDYTRAFAPAGGLHHAHRDRAAGFCVYNDCAIAIAKACAEHEGLRVAYVDIDAHHGDGVQEAFYDRRDVLTVSVHESGRYLFPGTGSVREIGEGDGVGFAVNIPLPPWAADADYGRVMTRVIEPAIVAFAPDVIVAQLGADAHRSDPLTHLGLTVAGHATLVQHIVGMADAQCAGRIAATGGGGYDAYSAVPRAWACAIAVLLDRGMPDVLPTAWTERAAAAASAAGAPATCVTRTFDEVSAPDPPVPAEETSRLVDLAIDEVRSRSPLLSGQGY